MPNADPTSLFDRLLRWDAQRRGFPGEHWLAVAAGLYLLARPRRSSATRMVAALAGSALIARALSGRDGALAQLDAQTRQRADDDFVDVAAPWPYDRRVRVSPPRRLRRNVRAAVAADAALREARVRTSAAPSPRAAR